MPKRRALIKHESTESDLSPPPADLLDELPRIIPEPSEPARKRRKVKTELVEVEAPIPARSKSRQKTALKEEVIIKEEAGRNSSTSTSKTKQSAEAKPATASKCKRKTREEKEAEAMPLLERTIGNKLFIGAHVSSAGGQSCFLVRMLSAINVMALLLDRLAEFIVFES
jgi:hypothetical protein